MSVCGCIYNVSTNFIVDEFARNRNRRCLRCNRRKRRRFRREQKCPYWQRVRRKRRRRRRRKKREKEREGWKEKKGNSFRDTMDTLA
jgi:hypothetical protein